MGIARPAIEPPTDSSPADGASLLARPVSVAIATLRALGLLAVALILILILLPFAVVAAGT